MSIPYFFLPTPDEFWSDEFLDDPIMMRFIRHLMRTISCQPQKVKNKGKDVELEPFEFIFGREKWAEKTGLSTKQIQNRINRLVSLNLCIKSESKTVSTFTVYKLNTEALSKNKGQHLSDVKGQHFGHQIGQVKNEKNGQHGFPSINLDELESCDKEKNLEIQQKGQHFSKEKGQQKGQHFGQNERTKNEDIVVKKETNKEKSLETDSAVFSPSFFDKDKKEAYEGISAYMKGLELPIEDATLRTWVKKYPLELLKHTLSDAVKKHKTSPRRNLEAYIQNALDKRYVEKKSND